MKAILLISMLCFIFFITLDDQNPRQVLQTRNRQIVNQAPPNNVSQRSPEHASIDWTIRRVTELLRKNADVNGDGLTNCIDAAVLFYQLYPDKNNARIMINRNFIAGMNHLYISVFSGGIWIAVEPQAYHTNHCSFLMQNVWGRRYDSRFSRDATQRYLRYVR
jgi:hypothetical protein